LDASDAIVGATLVPPALEEEIEEVEIQSGDGLVTTVEVIVETSEVEVSETEELDGDTEA
jgi:DNA gyrase subunit A